MESAVDIRVRAKLEIAVGLVGFRLLEPRSAGFYFFELKLLPQSSEDTLVQCYIPSPESENTETSSYDAQMAFLNSNNHIVPAQLMRNKQGFWSTTFCPQFGRETTKLCDLVHFQVDLPIRDVTQIYTELDSFVAHVDIGVYYLSAEDVETGTKPSKTCHRQICSHRITISHLTSAVRPTPIEVILLEGHLSTADMTLCASLTGLSLSPLSINAMEDTTKGLSLVYELCVRSLVRQFSVVRHRYRSLAHRHANDFCREGSPVSIPSLMLEDVYQSVSTEDENVGVNAMYPSNSHRRHGNIYTHVHHSLVSSLQQIAGNVLLTPSHDNPQCSKHNSSATSIGTTTTTAHAHDILSPNDDTGDGTEDTREAPSVHHSTDSASMYTHTHRHIDKRGTQEHVNTRKPDVREVERVVHQHMHSLSRQVHDLFVIMSKDYCEDGCVYLDSICETSRRRQIHVCTTQVSSTWHNASIEPKCCLSYPSNHAVPVAKNGLSLHEGVDMVMGMNISTTSSDTLPPSLKSAHNSTTDSNVSYATPIANSSTTLRDKSPKNTEKLENVGVCSCADCECNGCENCALVCSADGGVFVEIVDALDGQPHPSLVEDIYGDSASARHSNGVTCTGKTCRFLASSHTHIHSPVHARTNPIHVQPTAPPVPPPRRTGPPLAHLIVFVHGLSGSRHDFRIYAAMFRRHALRTSIGGHTRAHLLLCKSNEGNTYASLPTQAARVTEEIVDHINVLKQNRQIDISAISFVGHSQGALIVRLCVTSTRFRQYRSLCRTFLSLAGPHIGTPTYAMSPLVGFGLWFMSSFNGSDSITELQRADSDNVEHSLLYRLAHHPQGLGAFRTVILVATPLDGYVPYSSALIIPRNLKNPPHTESQGPSQYPTSTNTDTNTNNTSSGIGDSLSVDAKSSTALSVNSLFTSGADAAVSTLSDMDPDTRMAMAILSPIVNRWNEKFSSKHNLHTHTPSEENSSVSHSDTKVSKANNPQHTALGMERVCSFTPNDMAGDANWFSSHDRSEEPESLNNRPSRTSQQHIPKHDNTQCPDIPTDGKEGTRECMHGIDTLAVKTELLLRIVVSFPPSYELSIGHLLGKVVHTGLLDNVQVVNLLCSRVVCHFS
eukprot:CFRG5661T1